MSSQMKVFLIADVRPAHLLAPSSSTFSPIEESTFIFVSPVYQTTTPVPSSHQCRCLPTQPSSPSPKYPLLKMPPISHLSCILNVASSFPGYLCPICSKPNFTFFYVTPNDANNAIEINLHLAKQLVAAATIAIESIHNVAVMDRINADIRVKEVVSAKVKDTQVLDMLKNLFASKFYFPLFGDTSGNDTCIQA